MDIPSSKFTTFVSEKAHENYFLHFYIFVPCVSFDSLTKQFCMITLQVNMDVCRSATTPKSILVYFDKRFCELFCLPHVHAPNRNSCQVCGAALGLPINRHDALSCTM